MKVKIIIVITLVLTVLIIVPLIIIEFSTADVEFDKALFLNEYYKISTSAIAGFLFGGVTNVAIKEYEIYKAKKYLKKRFLSLRVKYSNIIKSTIISIDKRSEFYYDDTYAFQVILHETELQLLRLEGEDLYGCIDDISKSGFLDKLKILKSRNINSEKDLKNTYITIYNNYLQ